MPRQQPDVDAAAGTPRHQGDLHEAALPIPHLLAGPGARRRGVAPEIPLPAIFRGCVPFIVVEFLLVGALILWPGMTQLLIPAK